MYKLFSSYDLVRHNNCYVWLHIITQNNADTFIHGLIAHITKPCNAKVYKHYYIAVTYYNARIHVHVHPTQNTYCITQSNSNVPLGFIGTYLSKLITLAVAFDSSSMLICRSFLQSHSFRRRRDGILPMFCTVHSGGGTGGGGGGGGGVGGVFTPPTLLSRIIISRN